MNAWELILFTLREWLILLFAIGALVPMVYIYFTIRPVVLSRQDYIALMTCVLVIGLFYLMLHYDHAYGNIDLERHRAISRLVWFWLLAVSYGISYGIIKRDRYG